jgi:hypothetical protein
MTRRPQALEIGNIPELLRVAEEVRASRPPRVLKRGGDEIAVIAPVEAPSAGKRRKVAEAPPNAWSEDLVGIASSAGPGNVSSNKHKYLAEAYAAESDPAPRE